MTSQPNQASQPLQFDRARLSRAISLKAVPLEEHQFRVHTWSKGRRSGPEESEYYYYVSTAPYPFCSCSNACYQGGLCKHILAAFAAEGHPDVLPEYRRLSSYSYHLGTSNTPSAVEPLGYGAYFDTYSLEEAVQKLPEFPGNKQLAGRILTDPKASREEWLAVARHCDALLMRVAMLRILPLAQDPEIRELIASGTPDLLIITRMLPTAGDEEFRILFRKLIELGQDVHIKKLLEDQRERLAAVLQPADLGKLFTSSDREMRELALRLVGELEQDPVVPEPVKAGIALR